MSKIRTILAGSLVSVAALATATTAARAEFINILTGGTSGVYYPLGVALSEIYAKGIEGSRTQVQATKASVENLNLLASGKGEVAFALGDSVQSAWAGDTEAGFKAPLTNLRAIGGIYNNYVQVVAEAAAGVTTITDLKGKSISVGAPASGTELNARAIFKAAGMSYEDMSKVEYLPFGESAELIKNRQIQSTLSSAGLGAAFIKDLATTHEITVVAVPAEIVNSIGAPYVADVIPAGTYKGQDADVPTAAITNILVTSEKVSEETVYQMTKLMFENVEALKSAHSAAAAIDATKAVNSLPIPLHPGAEKYYREIGVLK
ncbi:TAXI family TRAP transporter solute-binding subunit [Falsigemmobacter intermedius]|uniref:TAXI family TRAP transporter solute-binding subunit n=1 Tax=Falsigemmobacter intermedius TaxID=1553448 RepID=A0A444MAW0_9RHOB|nr:TAXI family TRAP transporter solute-binding subunit [Falsigemmobacter intermedius]RWY40603.1 TAXI family TRAP transporter solute-binding subunit [Falsigemmobacter intermedius]